RDGHVQQGQQDDSDATDDRRAGFDRVILAAPAGNVPCCRVRCTWSTALSPNVARRVLLRASKPTEPGSSSWRLYGRSVVAQPVARKRHSARAPVPLMEAD